MLLFRVYYAPETATAWHSIFDALISYLRKIGEQRVCLTVLFNLNFYIASFYIEFF